MRNGNTVRLIPDASVAVKWYLPDGLEADAPLAQEFLRRAAGMLSAPDFLRLEVGGALLKRMRRGHVDMGRVVFAFRDLPECVELQPLTEALMFSALEFGEALRHHPHDCLYLAQAVAEDGLVVTADEKFLRKVEPSQWRDYVLRPPAALALLRG